jgi:hypothetical protein
MGEHMGSVAESPIVSQLDLIKDGKRVWHELYPLEPRSEGKYFTIKTEERPILVATPPELSNTSLRQEDLLCQTYEIRQYRSRDVKRFEVREYEAIPKRRLGLKVLMGLGIGGAALVLGAAAIVTAGAAVAVAGAVAHGVGIAAAGGAAAAGSAAAVAGTSAGGTAAALGIGTSVAGVGFGGAALLPTNDRIEDYKRGNFRRVFETMEPEEWRDLGPSREIVVGLPHPC